ncbi:MULTISPECIES: tyrosine-type recombinase/integrase [unclassified Mucilaginibacter]|uniref:tyrosine-type recombinase/integrase n=1 Tax=unclassified Mucilaginibacter TaxID=2617802 RepID=UPI003394D4C0
MKPSIIFKNKNGGEEYYAYVKYSVTEDNKKKVKLQSLNKNFRLSHINWGGKNEREKGKLEVLRSQGQYVKSNIEDAEKVNLSFSLELERITRLSHNNGVLTKYDFLGFLQKQIDELMVLKKYGTRDSYITLQKDLTAFLVDNGRTRMLFPDVTTQFVDDFETYLTGVRNLKKSTISVRMYKFKAIYEKAIAKDIYLPSKNVFYKRKFEGSKTDKGFLLPEEVEKLITSKALTNPVRGHYQEFDKNGCLSLQPIEKARLMFITQIFSNGMRVSDILFLRWNNLDFRDKHPQIKYRMYKTKEMMGFNLTNNLIWLLQHFVDTDDRFEDEFRPAEKVTCPNCESENIISGGHYNNGNGIKLTLRCKDCNRTFQNVNKTERKPVILTEMLSFNLEQFDDGSKNLPIDLRRSRLERSLPLKTSLYQKFKDTGYIYFNELNNEILELENIIETSTIKYLVFFDLLRNDRLDITDEERNDYYRAFYSYFENKRRIKIDDYFNKYYQDKSDERLNTFNAHKETFVAYLETLKRIKLRYIKSKNEHLIAVFDKYSSTKPNSFIFQMLKDEDFKDVNQENDFHKISPEQYLKYMNQSKRYNELLKKVRTHFDFKIPISTHTARYTFTYLMVEKNFDIYTISRLLGHSSVSITDRYLPRYLAHKANQSMASLNDSYDIENIRKKDSVDNKSIKGSITYGKNFL